MKQLAVLLSKRTNQNGPDVVVVVVVVLDTTRAGIAFFTSRCTS